MRDFTKAEKRKLRELAEEAYRRELFEELRDLHSAFGDWRRGRIDEFQLSDFIHDFHDGPSRDLYNFYSGRNPELSVARALARRLLEDSEVPAKIRANLADLVELAEDDRE